MHELFDDSDATGVVEAIAAGDVSAREATEFALARIDQRNPTVNAVVSLRSDEALAEVDAGLPAGPLHGLPYLIKDLGAQVRGLPTTEGSRLFADDIAHRDSVVVARLHSAGAVILGKTSSPEFGLNASTEPALHGPTRNPHGLGHSAGGSSGGSAAAVASGMVPAAHASDGGGSIRIPAAMTGLVGLKPSRGRVPGTGSMFGAPLSVHHAVTRSVRDTALLLDATCGPQVGDPVAIAPPSRPYAEEPDREPGRLRVAVCTALPDGGQAHPDCAAAAESAAALLAKLGHTLVDGAPDHPLEELGPVMGVGMAASVTRRIDTRLEELGRPLRDDDLEPVTRLLYEKMRAAPVTRFVAAMEALETASHRIGAFFVDHDILVTPTVARPTPELGVLDTRNVDDLAGLRWPLAFTSAFNATGQPAISLPLGADSAGMPLGVQLVAAYGREDLLLRVAGQIERARPWPAAPVWPPIRG